MTPTIRFVKIGRAACVVALMGASALWLVGCGETEQESDRRSGRGPASGTEVQPPPSRNEAPVVGPAAAPDTTTVAPQLPPNAAATEPVPRPTDGTRKPAQESDAKPMPGQNNDHSAPLGTQK